MRERVSVCVMCVRERERGGERERESQRESGSERREPERNGENSDTVIEEDLLIGSFRKRLTD